MHEALVFSPRCFVFFLHWFFCIGWSYLEFQSIASVWCSNWNNKSNDKLGSNYQWKHLYIFFALTQGPRFLTNPRKSGQFVISPCSRVPTISTRVLLLKLFPPAETGGPFIWTVVWSAGMVFCSEPNHWLTFFLGSRSSVSLAPVERFLSMTGCCSLKQAGFGGLVPTFFKKKP